MFYASLLVLCLASTATAQIYYPGKCPIVRAQLNLDLSKIEGKWYDVARYPTTYQRSTSCNTGYFGPEQNGVIKEVDRYINDTSGQPGVFYSDMVVTHENPLVLQTKLPVMPGIVATSHCQILGTDYDNYNDVYCCSQFHSFHVRYLYILTRTIMPDKSTLDKAYEVIVENGLSTEPIVKSNMENCSTSSAE